MEPKQSMTRYACIALLLLAVRGATGAATAAAYGAAALLLAG